MKTRFKIPEVPGWFLLDYAREQGLIEVVDSDEYRKKYILSKIGSKYFDGQKLWVDDKGTERLRELGMEYDVKLFQLKSGAYFKWRAYYTEKFMEAKKRVQAEKIKTSQ